MNFEEEMEESRRDDGRDGPGRRLGALRQSRELSLPRVAVMLHLDEETLAALEADDFERLPDPVFVQGYLKNYARLLDTPVGPILDAYRRARPDTEPQTALKVVRMRDEVKSSHLVVRLITWLIVLGLIALLVTWWRGYLTWPIASDGRDAAESAEPVYGEEPPLGEMVSVDDGATLPTESGTMDLPVAAPVDEPESPADGVGATAPAFETLETEPPGGVSTEPLAGRPEAEEREQTAEVAAAPPPALLPEAEPAGGEAAEEETAPLRVAEIEFLDECWTDIRDASGRFRIQGVLKKGARRKLEGDPPFKLVLGNASAVRITIDGDEYDLTPHIRANVARFNLHPDRL